MDAAPGSQPPRQVRVDSVSCRSECLRDILFRGLGSQWEIGGTTTDGLVKVILSWGGTKEMGFCRGEGRGGVMMPVVTMKKPRRPGNLYKLSYS